MASFRAVILTGPGQVRKDGLTQVKIKLTQNRKTAYIGTDIYVRPDDWKDGQATGINCEWTNSRIFDYLKRYTDNYLKIGDKAFRMNAEEVRTAVTITTEKRKVDFYAYMDRYIESIRGTANGTFYAAVTTKKHLQDYKPSLSFDEIDAMFLLGFEKYLLRQGLKNGIEPIMKRIRSIFNKGRDEYNDEDRGIIVIDNYPFRKFKIKSEPTDAKNHAITSEQIMSMLNYKPKKKRDRLAIDVFKIQFLLIGINIKDLFNLTTIKKGRIEYTRAKTGRKYSIRVEPELQVLIDKYRGENHVFCFAEKYKSKGSFIASINLAYKSISESTGMQQISTNWSRHSWATIGRNNCGITKDNIALCLGHKDDGLEITDRYIKYDHSIVDRCNRKVIDYVFKTDTVKDLSRAEAFYN